MSLSGSTTYAAKVVISESGEVDDDWSAGYAGLYRGPAGTSIQQYDSERIGYDNDGDGDIDDAGDDIQVSESLIIADNHLSRQPRMGRNWCLPVIVNCANCEVYLPVGTPQLTGGRGRPRDRRQRSPMYDRQSH